MFTTNIFFCNKHQQYYQNSGDSLICQECGKKISRKNLAYLFLEEKSDTAKEWDSTFQQARESLNRAKHYFDKLLWSFLPKLINHDLVQYIATKYPAGSTLVELGCGEGTASSMLLANTKNDFVLVDFNDLALELAVARMKKFNFQDRCLFVRDDFYQNDLCFPPHHFDVSFNNGTIEHFADPVKAIKKMKSISRRVVCVVPAKSLYFSLGTLIRKIIEEDPSHWTEHTRYYTRQELDDFFRQAGLKNIETKTCYFLGHPLCHFATGHI